MNLRHLPDPTHSSTSPSPVARRFGLTLLGVTTLGMTLLGTRATAQVRTVDPIEVTASQLPAPPFQQAGLWHDALPDGSHWVASASYKARVSATGLRFIPFLGSDAPRNEPVDLRVDAVTVAGNALGLAAAQAKRSGDRLTLDHGTLLEHFDVSDRGVAQSFEFRQLPSRGALRVDLAVTLPGSLEAYVDGPRLEFVSPLGGVGYGDATAIDATGRRLPLERRWTGKHIRIEVPAEFVAGARLPLVIDPLITAQPRLITANRQRDSHPDCCYDAATQRWLLVWQRDFSRTDADVWAAEYQLGNNAFTPVTGSLQPIDTTDRSWVGPVCANDAATSRNLVVAQTSDDGSSPWTIDGRVRVAGNRFPADPVELAGPNVPGTTSGDKTNPDVGGNPNDDAPGAFAVVWEQQKAAPADRDIRARLFSADSDLPTPVGNATLLLDGAEVLERNPSISPSCGRDSSVPGVWFVVFQRLFSADDDDIRLAMISEDGQIQGTISIGVSSSPDDERHPQVSSASDPFETFGSTRRQALVVWESAPASNPALSVIRGRLVRDDQLFTTRVLDISTRVGPSAEARTRFPQVDCDGLRYALSWTETDMAGIDSFAAMTLQQAGNDISFTEGPVKLGAATGAGRLASLTAEASGGAATSSYLALWEDGRGTGFDGIFASGYSGLFPGQDFVEFGQGCGGLDLETTGLPRPGATVGVRVIGTGGRASGQIWGELRPTPVVICPGCELQILGVALGNPVDLPIPFTTAIVGTRIDMQGFALGPAGGCAVEFTAGLSVRVR